MAFRAVTTRDSRLAAVPTALRGRAFGHRPADGHRGESVQIIGVLRADFRVPYSVTSRVREFGVRLALGATPLGVQRLVLTEALVLVITGVAIGVIAASGTSDAIRALLFAVSPLDPLSYAGAIVLLGLASVAASWGPARRAAPVNPIVALRAD